MHRFDDTADKGLFILLSQGDLQAFDALYERHSKSLYQYIYNKTGDQEEAKDLMQEVFTSLWVHREEILLHTSFSSYLYRLALNKILNTFRHKQVAQNYLDSLQTFLLQEQSETDYLVREHELTALIDAEINNLPDKMREVFELRKKAHLSNEEVAKQLGISEHTVATHMKKALKILRVKLHISAWLLLLSIMG